MKTRLAILGVLAAAALASSSMTPAPPAAAGDEWIGNYVYTIPGANVRAFLYCQAGQKISIYELTATDAGPWRYWLMVEDADLPAAHFSGTGRIAIVNGDLLWPLHTVGDVVTASVWGGPCWVAVPDPLEPRYARWLPLVLR
jgi:hypothetical protein